VFPENEVVKGQTT